MFNMKVIIADDEKWVRTAIIKTIPFEKLGLTLVSEATDGLEALELCNKYQPDILITDIMMPVLTGLDLIQKLKNSLPGLKVIIISGFNDFEYAKTAMKYGVQDFIVKPVDEEEIESILNRVKETIIEERKRSEKETFFKTGYSQAIPVLQEMFLNQIILPNSLTADAINKKLTKLGIFLPKGSLSVAVLSTNNFSRINSEVKRNYFRILFRRIIKRYTGGITFLRQGQDMELVAIFGTHDFKAAGLCQRMFSKRFCGTLYIGISSSSPQVKALPDLFFQASEALSYGLWSDIPILNYKEGIFDSSFDWNLTKEITDEMVFCIKACDNPALAEGIEKITVLLKSNHKVPPDKIKEYAWSIIQAATTRLDAQNPSSNCASIPSFTKIRGIRTFSQLAEYIKDIILEINAHFNSVSSTEISSIETAKKLIAEYYNSDFSLDIVAKRVHFNARYFSALFKKETGLNFIDYKTLLRIENAKRLLETTDLNISEISQKIGYNDPKYFSKLFKKKTGVTILEFKKGITR